MATTTRLEQYLDNLEPESRVEYERWMASRPPAIRALIERYPADTTIEIAGCDAFLIGYAETEAEPGFYFTFVDPHDDYHRAVAEKFFVCGEHLVTR